jgi:hypothetical protein
MRFNVYLFAALFFTVGSSAGAATIPADALINFQVDAYANVGNGPYSTHVSAWKNTGLFLNAGDQFALEAVGAWRASPAGHGAPYGTPEGNVGPDGDRDVVFGNVIAPYVPESRYALVGKIGTDLGDEFLVGSTFSGTANDTGFLYLGFNDTYYFDNSGSVLVSTAPVPEPSTALLLSLGLCCLAIKRAQRI